MLIEVCIFVSAPITPVALLGHQAKVNVLALLETVLGSCSLRLVIRKTKSLLQSVWKTLDGAVTLRPGWILSNYYKVFFFQGVWEVSRTAVTGVVHLAVWLIILLFEVTKATRERSTAANYGAKLPHLAHHLCLWGTLTAYSRTPSIRTKEPMISADVNCALTVQDTCPSAPGMGKFPFSTFRLVYSEKKNVTLLQWDSWNLRGKIPKKRLIRKGKAYRQFVQGVPEAVNRL